MKMKMKWLAKAFAILGFCMTVYGDPVRGDSTPSLNTHIVG